MATEVKKAKYKLIPLEIEQDMTNLVNAFDELIKDYKEVVHITHYSVGENTVIYYYNQTEKAIYVEFDNHVIDNNVRTSKEFFGAFFFHDIGRIENMFEVHYNDVITFAL